MKATIKKNIIYSLIINGICLIFSIIIYLISCIIFVMQGLLFSHVIQNNIPALPFIFMISYLFIRWIYNEIFLNKHNN
jgi:uncharacterized membrane protein